MKNSSDGVARQRRIRKVILPSAVSDEQILSVVRTWVDLLAADRYEEAHAVMLPSKNWTPGLMRTVVRHYGFVEPRRDGKTFVVTPVGQTSGGRARPYQDVDRYDDGEGMVHFDLPLNGEWSDVTAIIRIVKVPGGLALQLEDIHVL